MREGESLATVDRDELHPLQVEALRRMTPAERWSVAVAMSEMAWNIKSAGVRHAHPDWPESQLVEEVRRIFIRARA